MHHSISFDSLDEAITACEPLLNGAKVAGSKLCRESFDKSFSGVDSPSDARDIARKGLPRDGVVAIDVATKHIQDRGLNIRNQGFNALYADSGDEVDITRWLSGEEDHMLSWELGAEAVRPVATLIVEVCASAGITKKEIQKHGYKIMAAVEAIDASGMQTEIFVSNTVRECWGNSDTYRGLIKVKDAGEVFNPGRLMFAITHPSMLRVWQFAVLHLVCAKYGKEVPWSYGSPMPGDTGKSVGKDDFPETYVYIPGVGHLDSPNLAEDVLKQLGLIN